MCFPNKFLKSLRLTAATLLGAWIMPSAFSEDLSKKTDDWLKSEEGRKVTANILTWQSAEGNWPKNEDTTKQPFTGDKKKLKGTFDNGATTTELRHLARVIQVTGDESAKRAFLSGFDHILRAQYPNGGWPQYYPLSKQYHRHITFNDGSMTRILEFLRDVMDDSSVLDPQRRKSARAAFDRGIDCIVKCQIRIDGKPTVWCAQHDAATLAPTTARSYELPSLSGSESAGILRFLMALEKPSPEVVRAVRAGVAWFEASAIRGTRIEKVDGDRQVIEDASAPPLWARFYDLESGRPFFCDRDGVKKSSLSEIGRERRNGYAWYGNWGGEVLKAQAKWKHR